MDEDGVQLDSYPALMIKKYVFFLLFLTLVLASINGCVSSSKSPEFQQLTTIPKKICRIAILPFANDTDYNQGNIIFYRIFTSELNRQGGFTLVQEGDVRKIYRQMRISPKQSPKREHLLILADRLDVDAVIMGKIIEMQEKHKANSSEPILAVDLKVLDGETGKTMFTVYHKRSGEDYRKAMHFGLVTTITELSSIVSSEILELWFDRGLQKCSQ